MKERLMFPLAFGHPASWSTAAFVMICLGIVTFVLASHWWSDTSDATSKPLRQRRFACFVVVVAIYLLLMGTVVSTGLLTRPMIPNTPIFLVVSLAAAIALACLPAGHRVATKLPIAALVGFQSFRLPLEIVLHQWFLDGTIPETMTWSGANWDIVTGILALMLTPLVKQRLWLAWIFNVVGVLLLINVVRVAVLSSPFPFSWQIEPPLELALHLPYAYIVPVCVGGAAWGHAILFRRLVNGSL